MIVLEISFPAREKKNANFSLQSLAINMLCSMENLATDIVQESKSIKLSNLSAPTTFLLCDGLIWENLYHDILSTEFPSALAPDRLASEAHVLSHGQLVSGRIVTCKQFDQ